MAVSRRTSAAFTLVELLVVIAIIGVLMGLLLPALNAVRESARQAQCKSNLTQIGTAANSHLTTNGFFPSGGWGMLWLGDADRGTGAGQPGSWIYQLLPYMGLSNIHDLGKGQGSSTTVNTGSYKYTTAGPAMKGAVIPTFICATRRRAANFPDTIGQGAYNAAPGPNSGTPSANGLNHSDYCANTGTQDASEAFNGPSTSCLSSFPTNCSWDSDASVGDGVVYQASQVTQGMITDGMSNTFFAGEKWLNPYMYYNSTDAGDDNSMMQGFDHDIVRWCGQSYPPLQDANLGNTVHDNQNNGFGSAHSAGVNFVFCDGHVKLINYSINLTAYTHLGCRKDGIVDENY